MPTVLAPKFSTKIREMDESITAGCLSYFILSCLQPLEITSIAIAHVCGTNYGEHCQLRPIGLADEDQFPLQDKKHAAI